MLTLTHLTPLNRIFRDVFREDGWMPALDIAETPAAYLVNVELPGVDPEAVHLEIVDGRLEIRGEKTVNRTEEGHAWRRIERRHGEFRRFVQLPEDADAGKVDATYQHGVLSITVAKREEKKPHRIEIKTVSRESA